MEIPMIYYIVLSLVMFFAGVYGFITRKNMLMMLISIELMLNAVDINFAVFNRFLFPGQMEGMIFSIFAIAIAIMTPEKTRRGFLCSGFTVWVTA